MDQLFPENLITGCEQDIPLTNSTGFLKSLKNQYRISAESSENPNKGINGIRNLFSTTNSTTEEEKVKIFRRMKSEENQSTGKLLDIREETRVETLAENFGAISTTNVNMKTSKEANDIQTAGKSSKTHTRSRSASSVKDFARSVTSSIRRNNSYGSYEDQIKKKISNKSQNS